jgi:hypothetical protein
MKYYLYVKSVKNGSEVMDACVSQEKRMNGWIKLAGSSNKEELDKHVIAILSRNPK